MDTKKDYIYTMVVFQTNPLNATIPDLTLFISADNRNELMNQATELATKEVQLLFKQGKTIPAPRSLDYLRSRWNQEGIEFLSVAVRL